MSVTRTSFSRLVSFFLLVVSTLLESCTPVIPYSPFFEAAEQEEIEIVKEFLANDVDPNIVDVNGFTPLHSAVLSNNLPLAKLLLANHANPNVANNDGFTPLAYAAEQGYVEMAELLLANHANPDGLATDVEEFTYNPLQVAIENGHLPMVELLLTKNADIYMPDYYENLPMQLAIEHPEKNIALVGLLLAHNVNINRPDHFGITSLHVAAKGGNLEIVKLLLEQDADPTKTESDGYTPLHFAAMEGHAKIAALLINSYEQDWIHDSISLHWAVANGSAGDVERLLEDDEFDPNNTDYIGGFTPLLIAATLDRWEIGKILLDKGANPNATSAGLSPLQIAITNNSLDFFKLLLARGVSLDIVDQYSYNPLQIATKYGRQEMVSLLLAQGEAPDSVSLEDNRLLCIAASYGKLALAQFFVSLGMKVNSKPGRGNPLCSAAGKGHLDLVVFLLTQGADVHSRDSTGYTPLYLAAAGGHISVMKLLLRYGADVNAPANDANTFLHMLAPKPALFLQCIKAIEVANRTLLTDLQNALEKLFPILSSNNNQDILGFVVDYAQGIDWNLKNDDEETILDILEEKTLIIKRSEQLKGIFEIVNRHQQLGGWYQRPKNTTNNTKPLARKGEVLQDPAAKKHKKV